VTLPARFRAALVAVACAAGCNGALEAEGTDGYCSPSLGPLSAAQLARLPASATAGVVSCPAGALCHWSPSGKLCVGDGGATAACEVVSVCAPDAGVETRDARGRDVEGGPASDAPHGG
jgi:hypothetical protein